jgi:hypothetical protein
MPPAFPRERRWPLLLLAQGKQSVRHAQLDLLAALDLGDAAAPALS